MAAHLAHARQAPLMPGLKRPAAQARHSPEPALERPALHGSGVGAAVDAGAAVRSVGAGLGGGASPSWHRIRLSFLVKRPAGQRRHASCATAGWICPAAHAKQPTASIVRCAPSTSSTLSRRSKYRPGAQATQATAPARDTCPTLQRTHTVAPGLVEKRPAAQRVQAPLPSESERAPNLPAGQASQLASAVPTCDATLPTGQ